MDYQYQYSNKIGLPWVLKNIPHLVFPNLEKKKDRFKKLFQGVIATLDKKPIGLILSTTDNLGNSARIHSYFVLPEHRDQKVGNQLLRTLELALINDGVKSINAYYRSHWKNLPQLNRIFTNQNWNEPYEDLILVKGETKKVLKLFMSNKIQLPDKIHFTPWDQLTGEQITYIKKRKQEDNWYLDYLDPFVLADTIYPTASLALVQEGLVIGWVISHLISPETNEFTSLFIDAGQRQFKLAHLLMREAINRQHKDNIPNFLITSKTDNYVMSRFLIRHAPHTDVFFTRSFKVEKVLVK